MKRSVITIALLAASFVFCAAAFSQISIVFRPVDCAMKEIGTYRIQCTYEYSWLRDTATVRDDVGMIVSGDTADVVKETMLLHCGGPVSKWYSYDKYYSDSLILAEIRGQKVAEDVSSVKIGTALTVYKNYPSGYVTVTDAIGGENYMVKEESPDFGWKIADEWKEVAGYRVRKASCSFRGRDYVAWFAPEIPVSDGPWKFSGLPGLILEVHDTGNCYRFGLTGLEIKEGVLTMPDVNYIKTSLKKYYQTLLRYIENPMSFNIDPSSIHSVTVIKTEPGDEGYGTGGIVPKYAFQEIL